MLQPLTINRDSGVAHYRQLSEQIIQQIKQGYLISGARLPSSRNLSKELGIHRKSVVHAYEELQLQDWVFTAKGRGTFVADDLPDLKAQALAAENGASPAPTLSFQVNHFLHATNDDYGYRYHLDDGLPDPRLIPLLELERAQKTALRRGNLYRKLGYSTPQGSPALREALAEYLAQSRGLKVSPEEVLVTRGVTNALFLCLQALLKPGDKVILPEINWSNGDSCFRYHGAEILRVKVDEKGISIDHVAELLKAHPDVRMMYLTPHHQYPTTLIMPAGRRIQLLELARQHGVFLFEDDYDFDFHYGQVPILPLASTQHGGLVAYAGSFTKAVSPAFRLGYLVGDRELIAHLSSIRRILDRMGDPLLEMSILELLRLGTLQRSLRRARLVYQKRRDHLGGLLTDAFGDRIRFRLPDGGMAIWTEFDNNIDLVAAAKRARILGLGISDGSQYGENWNATRLGFASSTEEELEEAVQLLARSV